MATKKKPTAKQLAARAKFTAMVKAKAKARKAKAPAKKVSKKVASHKDSKSHNVKIHVVSGVKRHNIPNIKVENVMYIVKDIERTSAALEMWRSEPIKKGILTATQKKQHIKDYTKKLSILRELLKQQRKLNNPKNK